MADKPTLEIDEVLESLIDEKHTETLVEEVETLVEEVEKEKPKKTKKTTKSKTAKEMLEEMKAEEFCVCKTQSKTWKEVFIENYEGKSKEANMLKPHLKENYKGNVYIPWAVMERLTYMSDPDAEFVVVYNSRGGIVHTDCANVDNLSSQDGKSIESHAQMYSHFVKVALTFMGKTFVEDYPIQDTDYTALKVYNQNAVNKAIQRAKAKVAARGTGLGLKLYEGEDLQFEEVKEDKKPTLSIKEAPKPAKVEEKPAKTEQKPAKTEQKVELTDEQKAQNIVDGGETEAFLSGERTFTTQEVPVTEFVPEDENVKELINVLRNTEVDKMTQVLQRVNLSIMKKYGFALSLNDSDEELARKFSQFTSTAQFLKSIKNLLG